MRDDVGDTWIQERVDEQDRDDKRDRGEQKRHEGTSYACQVTADDHHREGGQRTRPTAYAERDECLCERQDQLRSRAEGAVASRRASDDKVWRGRAGDARRAR